MHQLEHCSWKNSGRKPAYVYYFTRALLGDDAGAVPFLRTLVHVRNPWAKLAPENRRRLCPQQRNDGRLDQFHENPENPNAEGKDDWKPCTKDDPYVQVLDVRK